MARGREGAGLPSGGGHGQRRGKEDNQGAEAGSGRARARDGTGSARGKGKPDPDPNAGRIECKLCGRFYWSLISHLMRKHDILPSEYRAEFGDVPVISPAVTAKLTLWTRATIVETLRERQRRGLPLNARAVGTDPARRGLWGGIYKRFGSFEAAIEALGTEYEDIRKVTAWSREKVLEGLRERVRRDLSINFKAVRRDDEPLVEAAVRWFGSYDAALRGLGLDPSSVRKQRVWSKEMILAELRKRAHKGLPLSHGAVHKVDCALGQAASSHFGSYGEAVEALGLRYEDVREHRSWNRRTVVEAIRERSRKGLRLNANAVAGDGISLVSAAAFWFGSYGRAVRAAGLDYEKIRRVHVWTKQDVVEGIRRRGRQGKPLNHAGVSDEEEPLAVHARVLWGSWDRALRAAGLDPERIRKWKSWSREEVLTLLRRYAREGVTVSQKGIGAKDGRLPKAATEQFGSWSAAVRAAGFRPGRFGVGRSGWVTAGKRRPGGGGEIDPAS